MSQVALVGQTALIEQIAELTRVAIARGYDDAAEWLMRVYGAGEDGLLAAQAIRAKAAA